MGSRENVTYRLTQVEQAAIKKLFSKKQWELITVSDVMKKIIPSRPPYTAFLGNLPYNITSKDIEGFFIRNLRVSNIRLPNDKGRMKGFGYVEFEDRQSLVDALTLNGTKLGGRTIRVDLAEKNQQGNDPDCTVVGGDQRGDAGEDKTLGDWRRKDDNPSFEYRSNRDDSRGVGDKQASSSVTTLLGRQMDQDEVGGAKHD